MDEIICTNCKEIFKADLSKKYFDCPHCKHEFSDPTLTKNQLKNDPVQTASLLEKING